MFIIMYVKYYQIMVLHQKIFFLLFFNNIEPIHIYRNQFLYEIQSLGSFDCQVWFLKVKRQS
jgi:hypothetical protein